MPDKNAGVLEVGTQNGEVVVNHPDIDPDDTGAGHIVFSPNQARNLADILIKQAGIAEQWLAKQREMDGAKTEEEKIAILLGVPASDVHKLDWSPEEAAEILQKRETQRIVQPVDRSAQTLTDGSPVTPDHREINPVTGQQKGYVVLSEEERRKGFVRPVRRTYRHVGAPGPKHELRDLTDEEQERYKDYGYVKYEPYPKSNSSVVGRFWTEPQLDNVGKGCQTTTTMETALAETAARDPGFYSGTFCCHCGTHLPLEEFVWEGTNERVGT